MIILYSVVKYRTRYARNPKVKLNDYAFKPINGKMRSFLEEEFLDSWTNEYCEYKPIHNATKRLCTIIEAKYEKKSLNKTTTKECQHLTVTKKAELLSFINKYERLLDGIIGT